VLAVFAQTPTQDAAQGPRIELSAAQRQIIYQSVSRTHKNHAEPTGFRVSGGATVPAGITSAPLNNTLTALIPRAEGFEVAMVEKQVVLLDAQTRQIAAVIAEKLSRSLNDRAPRAAA
jgi:hypothetical protein